MMFVCLDDEAAESEDEGAKKKRKPSKKKAFGKKTKKRKRDEEEEEGDEEEGDEEGGPTLSIEDLATDAYASFPAGMLLLSPSYFFVYRITTYLWRTYRRGSKKGCSSSGLSSSNG